jgi:putative NADH-flavin reductase
MRESDALDSLGASMDRRDALKTPLSLLLSAVLGPATLGPFSAEAADLPGPVVVVGASGGTGKECVNALLERGQAVRSIVRNKVNSKGQEAIFQAEDDSLLEEMVADVTSKKSMKESLAGSSAVIFAASASKKGGDPEKVDYLGLLNVAEACIANKVERLVVVSSGGVSRPDSAVYKFLNLFGKIMYWKIKGEDEMRAMYVQAKEADPSLDVSYTVVRPGGLTTGPATGVSTIELNQKDTKSGRISRADVAAICVECIKYPSAADKTFECYYADTAKPLNDVGLSNILKQKTSEDDAAAAATGLERRGETWKALFAGLKSEEELAD